VEESRRRGSCQCARRGHGGLGLMTSDVCMLELGYGG
jgi:hypothetical protein